ncbi:MAG: hypothetical protein JKY46_11420 [Robiginitomaculum sp.]|nr:hypothetical protein [Robiginitomaculum sp.]
MTSPKFIKSAVIGLSLAVASLSVAPVAFSADANPVFATKSISNSKIRAGVNAFEKGDFTKAAFFQKTALKSGLSKSRKVAAYTNLCAAEGALGNLQDAKTACSSALQIAATSWEALNNQGVVQWLSGNTAAAAELFAAAQSAAGGKGEIATQNYQLASQFKLAEAN